MEGLWRLWGLWVGVVFWTLKTNRSPSTAAGNHINAHGSILTYTRTHICVCVCECTHAYMIPSLPPSPSLPTPPDPERAGVPRQPPGHRHQAAAGGAHGHGQERADQHAAGAACRQDQCLPGGHQGGERGERGMVDRGLIKIFLWDVGWCRCELFWGEEELSHVWGWGWGVWLSARQE